MPGGEIAKWQAAEQQAQSAAAAARLAKPSSFKGSGYEIEVDNPNWLAISTRDGKPDIRVPTSDVPKLIAYLARICGLDVEEEAAQ